VGVDAEQFARCHREVLGETADQFPCSPFIMRFEVGGRTGERSERFDDECCIRNGLVVNAAESIARCHSIFHIAC
jgi:hypothetical protein